MAENSALRLLEDWENEKTRIEGFISDPLKWVAGELEKTYLARITSDPHESELWDRVKTLTSVIRFVDANKKLVGT